MIEAASSLQGGEEHLRAGCGSGKRADHESYVSIFLIVVVSGYRS
jgi:hypothetical protein